MGHRFTFYPGPPHFHLAFSVGSLLHYCLKTNTDLPFLGGYKPRKGKDLSKDVNFKFMFVLPLYHSNLQNYVQYNRMEPKGQDSIVLGRC